MSREAIGINVVFERKVALFVMTLPYSGAIFVQAFPRECSETFLEGHRRAIEFFGGVPRRISYDNSAIAVIEVLQGRERKLTREWREDYNEYRPHSSLGYATPAEFAAGCVRACGPGFAGTDEESAALRPASSDRTVIAAKLS